MTIEKKSQKFGINLFVIASEFRSNKLVYIMVSVSISSGLMFLNHFVHKRATSGCVCV